jgi:hypothetical protein
VNKQSENRKQGINKPCTKMQRNTWIGQTCNIETIENNHTEYKHAEDKYIHAEDKQHWTNMQWKAVDKHSENNPPENKQQ